MKGVFTLSRVSASVVVWLMGAAVLSGQTLTTLHSFNVTDGASPWAALIQGADGNFYGTTQEGGANNLCVPYNGCGTVFQIAPGGKLTTLWSFCAIDLPLFCLDGRNPYAPLLLASDGNFYGTTQFGGSLLYGTIFQLSPSGGFFVLHDFQYRADGGQIEGGLIQGTDGELYGTTIEGGTSGLGTVFKIVPDGVLSGLTTILHNFCFQAGCPDGQNPWYERLVQGTDGDFYGTTVYGGVNQNCKEFGGFIVGCGTVFKVTSAGVLTTLYSFCAQNNCADGSAPFAGLVQATDGNFYGTTTTGGANGAGTVFQLTPAGILTTLHSFNGTDGAAPYGGLIQARDANFYGTTFTGGPSNGGTVYELTPGGAFSTLHTFNGIDGSLPNAGLVQATDGSFYGTTISGGTHGFGTVFRLTVQAVPVLTTISPANAIAGGAGFTLTVSGTNFVSSSAVNFNGGALVTTFVSATELSAVVPASDITVAGSFNVTVTNPGGGTSSALSFTVVTPQQATQAITDTVSALFAQGVINGGQDTSLLVQLQHAIAMMNAGKNNGAIGNLDSFISQVNDLLSSGVLSPSQAASLTTAAQSVITTL